LPGGDGPAARRTLEAAGLRVVPGGGPDELWVEAVGRGSDVARLLASAGLYPDGLVRRRDSLEDVFLRLTDHAGGGSR
jgi:hypothetical protein